jgi:hypothetical protein
MDALEKPELLAGAREGELRYQANQLAKSDRRLADLLLRLRAEGASWMEALKELRASAV